MISLGILYGIDTSVHASSFRQITYEWENYTSGALDWADSSDDDSTGSTALGFSVTIGGATYSRSEERRVGKECRSRCSSEVPTSRTCDSRAGLIRLDSC